MSTQSSNALAGMQDMANKNRSKKSSTGKKKRSADDVQSSNALAGMQDMANKNRSKKTGRKFGGKSGRSGKKSVKKSGGKSASYWRKRFFASKKK